MKDQSPLRCRQRRRFFIGKRALHRGRRNLVNLISVNKSQTVMGLYGDAVEQVLFGNLQDVFNPANWLPVELRTGVPTSSAS